MKKLLAATVLSFSMVNIALAEGVDIFQAARTGNLAEINAYIESGKPLDVKDTRGSTPVIIAAYNGQLDAVRALALKGADVCAGDAQGQTALMGVSFKGYKEIASILAEKCDVNAQSNAGQTALMFASLFGRTEVVQLLLSKGAKKEMADIQGATAVTLAETQGNQAMVDLLNGKASAKAVP
jgi:ankyrin repeat protein